MNVLEKAKKGLLNWKLKTKKQTVEFLKKYGVADRQEKEVMFKNQITQEEQDAELLHNKLSNLPARSVVNSVTDLSERAKKCNTKILTLISTISSIVGLCVYCDIAKFTNKGIAVNLTTGNALVCIVLGIIFLVGYVFSLRIVGHTIALLNNFKKDLFTKIISIGATAVLTFFMGASMYTNFLTFYTFLFDHSTIGMIFSIGLGCSYDMLSIVCELLREKFTTLNGIDSEKVSAAAKKIKKKTNSGKRKTDKDVTKTDNDFKLSDQEKFDNFIKINFKDGETVTATNCDMKYNGTFRTLRLNCPYIDKVGSRYVVNFSKTTESDNKTTKISVETTESDKESTENFVSDKEVSKSLLNKDFSETENDKK